MYNNNEYQTIHYCFSISHSFMKLTITLCGENIMNDIDFQIIKEKQSNITHIQISHIPENIPYQHNAEDIINKQVFDEIKSHQVHAFYFAV